MILQFKNVGEYFLSVLWSENWVHRPSSLQIQGTGRCIHVKYSVHSVQLHSPLQFSCGFGSRFSPGEYVVEICPFNFTLFVPFCMSVKGGGGLDQPESAKVLNLSSTFISVFWNRIQIHIIINLKVLVLPDTNPWLTVGIRIQIKVLPYKSNKNWKP